ncbi:DM13 domain-containing protein [Arthrobacter sp. PAMC 25486]|uniref:DM13 domain-containing protein n=1 Tax=Arthrobacter sp. PAMC 25486 TaxID=1494608 RepID=UPI0009DCEAD3|nr:DM13 domain-containing protein [Arthrobacter sp. PAMC 25486]
MKFVRLLAVGIIFTSSISGCTTATAPIKTVQSPTLESGSSSPIATAPLSKTLSGTFVSQAVPTSGKAIITQTPDSLTLELEDFSTSAGDELHVTVSTGALTKNTAGDNVVNEPPMYMLGKLKSISGNQSYDLTYTMQSFPEAQSISIYNNNTREAFGSANLLEK